jgi:hypothetical protein
MSQETLWAIEANNISNKEESTFLPKFGEVNSDGEYTPNDANRQSSLSPTRRKKENLVVL